MQLYLIRHLQTEFNRQGILQGSQDIPILEPSEKVLEQIEKNKQCLNQIGPFDAILVSEYQRTHMTAECYGFGQNDIQVEKLLNELNFGQFEGKTKAELLAQHEKLWLENPQQLVLGEPLSDLMNRVSRFIESYKNYQSVLVFGHGSWSRAAYSLIKYGNIDKMNQMTIANNHLLQLEVC